MSSAGFPNRLIVLISFFTLGLLLLFTQPSPAAQQQFTDVSRESQSYPFIHYLVARNGMLAGYPDGRFGPDDSITRAEMAALLVRVAELTDYQPLEPTFNDVGPDHWAYQAVETAVRGGLFMGYGDGSFRPGAPVSRGEISAILLRLSAHPVPAIPLPDTVQDVHPKHWAAESIAAVLDAGMLTVAAPGAFTPNDPASRATVARGLTIVLNTEPDLIGVPVTGTVVPLAGRVTLMESGGPEVNVAGAASCADGVIVKTGSSGKAEIRFPDGSGLLLAENTQLTIKELRGQRTMLRDGTPGVVVDLLDVDLQQGRVFCAVAGGYFFGSVQDAAETDPPWWRKAFSDRERVRINVDRDGNYTAAGVGLWMVEVLPEGRRMSVLDGLVTVASAEETVLVPAGQAAYTLSPKGTPSPGPMGYAIMRAWSNEKEWVTQRAAAIQDSIPLITPRELWDDGEAVSENTVLEQVMSALTEVTSRIESTRRSGRGGSSSREETPPVSPATVAPPTADPLPGEVGEGTEVSLSTTTDGAAIYYTVDGSNPTTDSMSYTDPIVIDKDATIKAIAAKDGMNDSPVATFQYTVRVPAIVSVAGGRWHSLAVENNGTVWAWGRNHDGQLGNDSPDDSSTPVQVEGLSGITAVAGSSSRSLALDDEGNVWEWGNGESIHEVDELSQVTSVASSYLHFMALKEDGTVWAWGYNGYGQLGDQTNTTRSLPVKVYSLNDVLEIAAGYHHSLALTSDGTVWAWGNNGSDQLGNTEVSSYSTVPVEVYGLTGVTAIAAGSDHSLALRNDGTVWAWGLNNSSQLGDGTTTDRAEPVQVLELTEIIAIATGADHSIALKDDGSIWLWGDNSSSQLGDKTTIKWKYPVQPNELDTADAIATGGNHTLALKNGVLWAWGNSEFGQVGDGTSGEDNNVRIPVPVTPSWSNP